jgi:ribose transport system permease protein/L-arabinose transport system permease protein
MSSPARTLARDERTGEPLSLRQSLPARLVAAVGTHNLSLLIALVVLVLIFGGLKPHIFFLPRNLLNIGLAIAILGVLAMSQTVVIVSGGLDISVGAIVGLATVSTALGIQATGSPALGVLAGIVVGGMAGLVNGTIITMGPVNAVIATLGTMAVFRGIAFIISGGQSISIFNDGFRVIGAGTVLGLPVPILILLVTALLFHIFLARTIIGRNIYAIGGNPVVARFAGLGLTRYRIGIYIMSGAAAGLGGVLLAARTGSGQPISGSDGLELQAITAAVLGGCALQGGKGTIAGALLGVIILGVLNNGMILTSVPTFYQLLARGALLIAAVVIAERQLSWRGE